MADVPAERRKKDRWDKIGVFFHPLGGLLTALSVAYVGMKGSAVLERRQSLDTNARLYSELMSRREESESSLRKDMLTSIISSFLTPGSVSDLDSKVLNLELLAYNFHDSLDLRPLFLDLQRRIRRSKDPDKGELRARLVSVAREITAKQLFSLEGHGKSFRRSVDMEELAKAGKAGIALDAEPVAVNGESCEINLRILGASQENQQLNVRLTVKAPEGRPELPDTRATFDVGFFDFPMIDNTRLANGVRCAVTLSNFSEFGADLTAVCFPGEYASLKDRPYYDEVIKKLREANAGGNAARRAMIAMVLERQRTPLARREVASPVPGPGEVRVRVGACGVCRTDLHVVDGELPPHRLPLIPGHQAVGRVEALGPGCTLLEPGDRVGIAWLRSTCGACVYCRSGRENLCPFSRYTGWDEDGGYAEEAIVPEAYAYPLPGPQEDVAVAPLLCAGIIGWRALKRAELARPGRLGLYGFGSSAHVVLALARHLGHEVHVVTREARHQALALRLGAASAVGGSLRPPVPLDAAIVFAPSGEVVEAALRAVGPGGTVVTAGITMTPIPALDYEACLFHERQLRSVEANTREDGRELLAAAAAARFVPEVTRFSLHEANEALRALREDRVAGTAVLDLAL